MVKIFILLVVGGVIGWIASLIMKTDKAMGPAANIAVGVGGALIASLALSRGAIVGELTLISLLAALAGSVILLAIANLIKKGRIR